MSEVKLKPCPFCSGKPKMATCDWGYSVKEYWYYCSSCGCETQKYHSKEDAAEQWNTRKPIDNIVERLEEFYDENEFEINSGFIETCIDIVKGGVEDGKID